MYDVRGKLYDGDDEMMNIPEEDVLRDKQTESKGIKSCGTLLIRRHVIPGSDKKKVFKFYDLLWPTAQCIAMGQYPR